MPATGASLRKRGKRNIIKVKGQAAQPYDELLDKFEPDNHRHLSSFRTLKTGDYNSGQSYSSSPNNASRITRIPIYHLEEDEDILDLEDFDEEAVPPKKNAIEVSTNRTTIFNERPTLLSSSIINRLRLIIGLGMISGALPWYWNSRRHRIEKFSPSMMRLWWLQWTLITAQTCCITCFQFHIFFGSLSGKDSAYRGIFMGSLNVFWFFFAVVYRAIVYFNKDKMQVYINTMLSFNADHVEKYVLHLDGYRQGGMMVMNVSIPATCIQIGTSLAIFLLFHNAPWYLTSYVQPKPWYWLIPGGLHDMILIASDITIFMLMGWIVVAHTNSVDFWLKEIHNTDDTDYTTDELRSPLTAISSFRSLSVLNATFNNCMAGMAIPMLKLTVCMSFIICGYVLVRSMNHVFIDEFPSILMYPFAIINCVASGFGCISMAAEMYDLGISFVDSWSRTKHKSFRRILMSCATCKVKVGGFYFITVATTVTFFKIISDQIINCIITFP